tara:strand:+ start:98 stop:346 length:249 start_codon:yes stop_codon:yes gene_type:complete
LTDALAATLIGPGTVVVAQTGDADVFILGAALTVIGCEDLRCAAVGERSFTVVVRFAFCGGVFVVSNTYSIVTYAGKRFRIC